MGKVFAGIDDRLSAWIMRQPLFFVGTAPLSTEGHVNVSPKGPIGTLRVLDRRTVAYLDLVGSGAETIAHLRENGRIVMPDEPRFKELIGQFEQPEHPQSRRAIVIVNVTRIADSCGYGVPLMS